MPTYGYQCTQCDNAFETVQKITDDPLTTCDACGGQLRKKIFPVGIAFKGSGFYVNDYAKPSPGGNAPAASGTTDAAAAPATGGDSSASPASGTDNSKPSAAEPATGAPASSPAPPAPSPAAAAAPTSS